MPDEKREWQRIQIYYQYGDWIEIRREDLDRIDAIDDVVSGLNRAKNLIASFQGILGD